MERIFKGEYFQRPEQLPIAIAVHEAAIQRVRRADHHYLALGRALTAFGALKSDAEDRQGIFLRAGRVLDMGSALRPFDSAFPSRRGYLFLKWSELEHSPERKTALARKSIDYFKRGLALDPGNAALWNNVAYVELTILRSLDDAHRSLLHSIELSPYSHPARGLLGDVLYQKGHASTNGIGQMAFFKEAVTQYGKAMELVERSNREKSYLYSVGKGKSLIRIGDLPHAIAAYRTAAIFAPDAERWRNEEMLARLFSDAKDRTNSLLHWQRALELAPPEKRPSLIELRKEILSQP